jgi:hypothetical protein
VEKAIRSTLNCTLDGRDFVFGVSAAILTNAEARLIRGKQRRVTSCVLALYADNFSRIELQGLNKSAQRINTECLSDFGSTQFARFAPAALRCGLIVTDCQ